jgi:hypothetical protein
MPSASWPKKGSPFLKNSEKLVKRSKKVQTGRKGNTKAVLL